MTAIMPPFEVDRTPFGPGISLIEASAGTGKTFNIAMSVVRLLLEMEDDRPVVDGLANILVVTFTNAATEELVTRIRNMLHLARDVWSGALDHESLPTIEMLRRLADGRELWALMRIREALAALDSLSVFTIHGFCRRVLDEFALESGASFGVQLLEDGETLVTEAMEDWWRRTFYEDASLAAWVVAKSWSPQVFARDYTTWRRWPDADIDPVVAPSAARTLVRRALDAFVAVWSIEALRTATASVQWNKDAPLATAFESAEALDDLERLAARVMAGDLAAAQEIADMLRADALHAKANKAGKQNRAAADAILDWPIARQASVLHEALLTLELSLRADCLLATDARVRAIKQERNVIGFDDLLARLHAVLAAQGSDGLLARAIRRQYQAALIDEFQDTDSHQFHVFRIVFAERPLFLIGDPKQAIYGFRGADVRAYLAAGRAAAHRYTLGQNHRSTPAMVQAVNALFSRRAAPFVDDEIRFHPAVAREHSAPADRLMGRHALQWLYLPPEERNGKPAPTSASNARILLLQACADIVVRYVAEGWNPNRIAVLVRAGHEGADMVRLLADAGVPAVLTGLGDVMHSREMEELQRVLEAIAAPGNFARVRAALTTSLWGLGHDDLHRLNTPAGEAEWEEILNHFVTLRDLWVAQGVLQLLGRLFELRQVVARFLAQIDGERRLTNLRHAQELLHEAAESEALGMEGLLRWLESTRAQQADARGVRELRLESDDEAVQVVTVHRSKGLEYDIVLCPTLWNVRRVDASAPVLVHEGERVVFDHGSPQREARIAEAERERLAEDCRLVYVALTRARYRTYVGWGPIGRAPNGSEHSALSWLLYDGEATNASPADVAESLRDDLHRWEPMLRSLVDAHASLMAVDIVDSWRPAGRVPAKAGSVHIQPAARTLPAFPPPRERFSTFSIASFTSLTAGSYEAIRGEAHEGVARDRDDQSDVAQAAPVVRDAGDFRTFPAGTGPGIVLHALFERARFDATDEELRALVTKELEPLGMNVEEQNARIEAVLTMMRGVLRSRVGSLGFSLDRVPASRTKREWQFLLPLASTDHALTKQGLAHAFERYGGARGAAYADQIRALGIDRVHGFLTGFVDLLFEHEGRWYVVDWKSNQLGFDVDAYAEASLERVMAGHHYILQYHLYLVAVHRFLKQRVPGYRYETHVGGAAYAFLRGFSPTVASGSGWYVDRPDVTLIDALDAVLDGRRSEIGT